MSEADEHTPEAYDDHLNMEFLILIMGDITKAKVMARKQEADGIPFGCRDTLTQSWIHIGTRWHYLMEPALIRLP